MGSADFRLADLFGFFRRQHGTVEQGGAVFKLPPGQGYIGKAAGHADVTVTQLMEVLPAGIVEASLPAGYPVRPDCGLLLL